MDKYTNGWTEGYTDGWVDSKNTKRMRFYGLLKVFQLFVKRENSCVD